jgi:hypothetical protein
MRWISRPLVHREREERGEQPQQGENIKNMSDSIPEAMGAAASGLATVFVEGHGRAFDTLLHMGTLYEPDRCKFKFDADKYKKEFSFEVTEPGELVRLYDDFFKKPGTKDPAPYYWRYWKAYVKLAAPN